MLNDDDLNQMREIAKEEISKLDIINYINCENEKQEMKKEIQDVITDLKYYDKEFNTYSIEYRLEIIEKLILNIKRINKLILKLMLVLFVISIIMLLCFLFFVYGSA